VTSAVASCSPPPSIAAVARPLIGTAGAEDLGICEKWVPLFDRYGVDLVVLGTSTIRDRLI
jgi:hypothetical protein